MKSNGNVMVYNWKMVKVVLHVYYTVIELALLVDPWFTKGHLFPHSLRLVNFYELKLCVGDDSKTLVFVVVINIHSR